MEIFLVKSGMNDISPGSYTVNGVFANEWEARKVADEEKAFWENRPAIQTIIQVWNGKTLLRTIVV